MGFRKLVSTNRIKRLLQSMLALALSAAPPQPLVLWTDFGVTLLNFAWSSIRTTWSKVMGTCEDEIPRGFFEDESMFSHQWAGRVEVVLVILWRLVPIIDRRKKIENQLISTQM